MLRQTKIKDENKTELQAIREELGYSRPAFAEKVIHKSPQMLCLYEKGHKTPESVLALARIWLDFYRKQKGGENDKLKITVEAI